MKLICEKCNSDQVVYFEEGNHYDRSHWIFQCGACHCRWRPSMWRHEPAPAAFDYWMFEAFVDELRTALAGKCSCMHAPCYHYWLRLTVQDAITRAERPGWDALDSDARIDRLTIARTGGKGPYSLAVTVSTTGNLINTDVLRLTMHDLPDEDADFVARKMIDAGLQALAELGERDKWKGPGRG